MVVSASTRVLSASTQVTKQLSPWSICFLASALHFLILASLRMALFSSIFPTCQMSLYVLSKLLPSYFLLFLLLPTASFSVGTARAPDLSDCRTSTASSRAQWALPDPNTCQRECWNKCHKECQKECQNKCQIECQKRCQI